MRALLALPSVAFLAVSAMAVAVPRPAEAPETPSGSPDKMVCKTFTRTGTLADRYRTCKTKAEWERERTNLRDLDRSYGCRMNDAHADPCK